MNLPQAIEKIAQRKVNLNAVAAVATAAKNGDAHRAPLQ
jgi:hypothetical protein